MTDARFHPDAQREFVAAGVRYEALRPGFGERFIARVDDAVASLSAAPTGGTRWAGGPVRTWRVRQFPYLVVYLPEPEGAVIVAVAHTRRRPGYWERRLE